MTSYGKLSEMDWGYITAADQIMHTAHLGQFRKDGLTPYAVHPEEVADLVFVYGGSRNAIIAAKWHDIIEENPVYDLAHAASQIGIPDNDLKTILEMVFALTLDASILDRNKKRSENTARILRAPPETILVKICDRIINVSDMKPFTKAKKLQYLVETEEIIRDLAQKAKEYGYLQPFEDLIRITMKRAQEIGLKEGSGI